LKDATCKANPLKAAGAGGFVLLIIVGIVVFVMTRKKPPPKPKDPNMPGEAQNLNPAVADEWGFGDPDNSSSLLPGRIKEKC